MEENKNEEVNVTTDATENIGVDYIAQIEQLKKNSVPRAEYDKLKSEQERMLKVLQEGGQVTVESGEPDAPSVDALRKELFTTDCELSNLDYCTKALELRKQILEQEGKDIFVASNPRLAPTQFDYERAAAVAETMAECIKYANGDSEAFTNELMRRTNDVSPTYRGR